MPRELPKRWKRLVKQRLLAYIDILGWKALIGAGEDVRILQAVHSLKASDRFERTRRKELREYGVVVGNTLKTTTFSDSIVLSCAPRPDEVQWLVLHVQLICRTLLVMGHYTRGALTVGPVVQSGSTIAGRALLEAYLLERDVAKYPRILVSDSARSILTSPVLRRRALCVPAHIRKDFDGLEYLEIFDHWGGRRRQNMHDLALHQVEAVRREIARTRSKKAKRHLPEALNHRAKYAWMLSYLTSVLDDPIDPKAPAPLVPERPPS